MIHISRPRQSRCLVPLSNTRSVPRASNTLASAPPKYSLNTLGGHPWSDFVGSEGPLDMSSDAMNYLDAVKMQFRDKPEVYCRFLDTMQDFRHLRIDCAGVIERLGTLLYGKPSLLEGFNMFLPRGYRIDISTDPRNPNLIMVTTPQGIKIQNAAPPESYQG